MWKGRPDSFLVKQYQGDSWHGWRVHKYERVSAVKFEDGSIWDCFRGWEGQTIETEGRLERVEASLAKQTQVAIQRANRLENALRAIIALPSERLDEAPSLARKALTSGHDDAEVAPQPPLSNVGGSSGLHHSPGEGEASDEV